MNDVKWLIAREIPRLRRFALSLTDTPEEADDLVQDCLERAMRKRQLWRRRGSVRSWLYRMLYNLFVNQSAQRLRRRRQLSLADLTEAETGLSAAADQEHHLAFREIGEAMIHVPIDQRAAIILVAVEGFTYDEAAAVMGVPVGTVRSRLSRGRERLRHLYVARDADLMLRRVK